MFKHQTKDKRLIDELRQKNRELLEENIRLNAENFQLKVTNNKIRSDADLKSMLMLNEITSLGISIMGKKEIICKHEWMRMQYAEEEFKCVHCGETRPEVYE